MSQLLQINEDLRSAGDVLLHLKQGNESLLNVVHAVSPALLSRSNDRLFV